MSHQSLRISRKSFIKSKSPPRAILSFMRQCSCIWSVRHIQTRWTSLSNGNFPYKLTKLRVSETTEAPDQTDNRLTVPMRKPLSDTILRHRWRVDERNVVAEAWPNAWMRFRKIVLEASFCMGIIDARTRCASREKFHGGVNSARRHPNQQLHGTIHASFLSYQQKLVQMQRQSSDYPHRIHAWRSCHR
jgi:hypothetical protein